MILQALTEYYERLAEQGIVSKPGWSTTKVSDAIVLDFDGQIIGVLPLKEVIIRGTKKMEVSRDCKVPQMVSRSSGIKANFLAIMQNIYLALLRRKRMERNQIKRRKVLMKRNFHGLLNALKRQKNYIYKF